MSKEGRAARTVGGCVAAMVAAIVVGLLLCGLLEVLRVLAMTLAALVSVAWGGVGL